MKTRLYFVFLIMMITMIYNQCCADSQIMVVTDIHYLAPSLYEGSDLFLRSIANADGKMTHYSPELLDALLAEARHQKPDVVLITGDLTFYGEKQSHQELAAAMDELWDEGIPVYVIPGNHDINSPYARWFSGEDWGYTDNVTPEEFREIWARCLLPSEDGYTMSYTVRLNDKVWIAMADVCVYDEAVEMYGFYSQEQQAWLVPMLEEAKTAGVTVISATHQSLIPRSSSRPNSYSIYNREYMLPDLRAGGVTLNLSGHIHIMSVLEKDGLTDAATGAFCIHSHCYGLVTVGEDGIPHYERHTVCDEHLPEGFKALSEAFFSERDVRNAEEQLAGLDIPEDARRVMVEYARRVNADNFAGILDPNDPKWLEDPALELWAEYAPETGTGTRLLQMFDAH